jgi:hypothetical protein
MRRFVALLILGAVTVAVPADEKKSDLRSSKEADGWLRLFDGEGTFGWEIDGEAAVKDGELVLGGKKETTARLTTEFGDAQIRLEYRKVEGSGVELAHRGATAVLLAPNKKGVVTEEWTASGGKLTRKGGKEVRLTADRGAPTLRVPAGGRLHMRSLMLRPLGTKSLFNGKDLTGWKVFPQRKSQFTVTSEGWLNVKDGPGDLQTEGQWADFVLQLECISNGKHLNSGIFFRALPDQYQQGYEAQIRNEFTEEPKQEYTIEEFDPKTHQPGEKRKVKSVAVDYGTGAIYRRQPARKQMSKDGEWFAMTIVAHGRHLATWVNGVQVTDWTDNRAPNVNARSGCRLEKGCVTIQGHDPTTDLSFRNLRVAELPPAK